MSKDRDDSWLWKPLEFIDRAMVKGSRDNLIVLAVLFAVVLGLIVFGVGK